MKREEHLDWTDYITKLTDLPSLSARWEKDMINEITDKISEGRIERILEVGCSNGRWLRWFCQEYNCEAYGIDNNPAGFQKRDINFTVGDAFRLPYRDNFFDAVFSKGFLEHFKKHERFLMLKEQKRVLKNDGFLICVIPPLGFSLELLYVKYCDFRCGGKHHEITDQEFRNFLDTLNLKIISSRFLGWFFERFQRRLRFKIPKLLDSRFTSNDYILIGIKK
jgi:SAM-dependent methyltransferase